jgi:Tfp pilus assembly protein PilF
LAINPQGIDPNFFYGEYLIETKQPDQAVAYLERAHQRAAPDRATRWPTPAGARKRERCSTRSRAK